MRLKEDEVVLYADRGTYPHTSLHMLGLSFIIKEQLDSFVGIVVEGVLLTPRYFLVVYDDSVLARIYEEQKKAYEEYAQEYTYYLGFDLKNQSTSSLAFYHDLKAALRIHYPSIHVESKEAGKDAPFSFYGGFLFIGVFLGTLFLMAAALILIPLQKVILRRIPSTSCVATK